MVVGDAQAVILCYLTSLDKQSVYWVEWVEAKPTLAIPRDNKSKSLVRPFLAGRVKRRLAFVRYVRHKDALRESQLNSR